MQLISAKYIFDGVSLRENSVVLFAEGMIIDVIEYKNLPELQQKQVVNYGSGVICAGFIDLQLNGCGGVLFNDDISEATLEVIYKTCLKYGTTSFLPTLITCNFTDVIQALKTIKIWFDKYKNLRGVIGLHLEGPFISKLKSGIHAPEFILSPTEQLLAQIVTFTKYFPIKMTIAVEEFSLQQIKYLVNNGVILAVGHSDASYQQVVDAIQAGVKCATHTFNAMTGLTAREAGVIGGVLNNQDIYAGVIVDLLHVEVANIQLLYKLKQANKMYLVSDSVTPAGTDMQEFMLSGKRLRVIDGKCIDDRGILGGASLMLLQTIRNCVEYCGIKLEDALNMASKTPAVIMQLEDKLGSIQAKHHANMIYLDLTDYSAILIT